MTNTVSPTPFTATGLAFGIATFDVEPTREARPITNVKSAVEIKVATSGRAPTVRSDLLTASES